jgi:hypothetical protein
MAFAIDPNKWFAKIKSLAWQIIKEFFIFIIQVPDWIKTIIIVIFIIITILLVRVAWKERGQWLRVEY